MNWSRATAVACAVAGALLLAACGEKPPEIVEPKYGEPVDLGPFQCDDVKRSSFVNRLCYRPATGHVIVRLNGVDYAYCDVPPAVVERWRSAPSMGRYYNQVMKGRYACR